MIGVNKGRCRVCVVCETTPFPTHRLEDEKGDTIPQQVLAWLPHGSLLHSTVSKEMIPRVPLKIW